MSPSSRFPFAALAGALLLSACGADKPAAADPGDRELKGGLAKDIQIDPALVGRARPGGETPPELPADQRGPQAVAAARAEATKLAGGSIDAPPAPSSDPASAKAIAEAGRRLSGGPADCAAKAEQGAAWAGRVPGALAPYPRAKVIEAAGTDRDGCSLRVVSFVTPVGVADVLGYYHTRTRAEGMSAVHRLEGTDHVLGGASAVRAYVIYARALSNGFTEVDIMTTG